MEAPCVDFFIIQRRPQAGFVLTTRRIYQISRLPSYRDIFGMSEPLISLDVIVHDGNISLSVMQMESFVPLSRRCYLRLMRFPVFRRGGVLCEAEGVGLGEPNRGTFLDMVR